MFDIKHLLLSVLSILEVWQQANKGIAESHRKDLILSVILLFMDPGCNIRVTQHSFPIWSSLSNCRLSNQRVNYAFCILVCLMYLHALNEPLPDLVPHGLLRVRPLHLPQFDLDVDQCLLVLPLVVSLGHESCLSVRSASIWAVFLWLVGSRGGI